VLLKSLYQQEMLIEAKREHQMFTNELEKIDVKEGANRYEMVMTMDIETYYSIINSLRESCGCETCKHIAEAMMVSRRINHIEK
jgi:hypothetical protein